VRVLGVETSCDETSFALVEDGVVVRSCVVASQDEVHSPYGGVVPELASRAHVERLAPTLERALSQAGIDLPDVDAVAVGHRPGLIGSLLVGLSCAKALAWALGRPLVGVDHIHAHLYAPALEAPPVDFPAIGLVVSGGHTALFTCQSPIDLTLLGSTVDDAAGEAFDKAAQLLGLGYPGGPRLARLAEQGDERAFDFPVSRIDGAPLAFSFSGLKTAALYAVRGAPKRSTAGELRFARKGSDLTERERADVAASFQRAVVDQLLDRVERAVAMEQVRSLLVGGGVSANALLRQELAALCGARGIELRLAPLRWCVDNAAMIAGLGFHLLRAGRASDLSLEAQPASALIA